MDPKDSLAVRAAAVGLCGAIVVALALLGWLVIDLARN
jgi:hypothetical protein